MAINLQLPLNVRILQIALNKLNAAKLKPDGDFGSMTRTAIINYQTKIGMTADGKITQGLMDYIFQHQITPLTAASLQAILPMSKDLALKHVDFLNTAMVKNGISTVIRAAMYLANLGVESGNFSVMAENLNYSADGLARVWPTRYRGADGKPNGIARELAGKPEMIANVTYAGRMGNGDSRSGDGWKYRGQGPIQTTGKSSYVALGAKLGINLVAKPELLQLPEYGQAAAADYWSTNKLSVYSDSYDLDGVCDKINIGRKTEKDGDAHGYVDRRNNFIRAIEVLV